MYQKQLCQYFNFSADNLIKKNNELTEMNTELCNLIEENQINPVTKEAMSVSKL